MRKVTGNVVSNWFKNSVWRHRGHHVHPCDVIVSGEGNRLRIVITRDSKNKIMELEISGTQRIVQIKEWCEHLLAQQGYYKNPVDRDRY